MKTKQKSSKEKNRAESRALNHGAFLSQYLNGFCFLFINERHGFLKINRMVFSFFFMFVAWPIFSFFCSFTETQKNHVFTLKKLNMKTKRYWKNDIREKFTIHFLHFRFNVLLLLCLLFFACEWCEERELSRKLSPTYISENLKASHTNVCLSTHNWDLSECGKSFYKLYTQTVSRSITPNFVKKKNDCCTLYRKYVLFC